MILRPIGLTTLAAIALCACNFSQAAADSHESASTRRGMMSPGFSTAHAKFAEYAAKTLGTTASNLKVIPFDEEVANDDRIGHLRQFETNLDTHWVGGWAMPDGTVVTYRQNLGKLFEEAGFWSGKPTLSAQEIANRLAWSMGMNHKVVNRVHGRALSPTLKIDPAGDGTLTFLVQYRQPGPGGAGGGPYYEFECSVALSKNHSAHLSRSKNLNGDANANPQGLAQIDVAP